MATTLQFKRDVPWAVALVVSLAWLYAGPLFRLVGEWTGSADASYGLVLAAAALVIAWKRRTLLTSSAGGPRTTLGLGLLVSGLLLFLVGQLAADIFLTRVSFVFVTAGIVGFIGGSAALRVLVAPLLFLLLAIPLPTLVVNTITLPLQLVASRIAEATLTLASVPVFREGNLLSLPSTTLEVAEACSGLRSAISLGAIAVVLAWAMGGGAIRRAALVATTIPVAVVMNGFRIAATGMLVEQFGPAFGKGAWHELTGWITFAACLAVLFAVQFLLSRTPRAHADDQRWVAA